MCNFLIWFVNSRSYFSRILEWVPCSIIIYWSWISAKNNAYKRRSQLSESGQKSSSKPWLVAKKSSKGMCTDLLVTSTLGSGRKEMSQPSQVRCYALAFTEGMGRTKGWLVCGLTYLQTCFQCSSILSKLKKEYTYEVYVIQIVKNILIHLQYRPRSANEGYKVRSYCVRGFQIYVLNSRDISSWFRYISVGLYNIILR